MPSYAIHLPFVASTGGLEPRPEPITAVSGVAGNPWTNTAPPEYYGAKLGAKWAHSWNLWHGIRDGVELIPVLWGWHRTVDARTREGTAALVAVDMKPARGTRTVHINYLERMMQLVPMTYQSWVLFVNEPADAGQANLTPADAATLFEQLCLHWTKAKIVGPQMLIGLDNDQGFDFYGRAQTWMLEWWRLLPNWARARVDAWSCHVYHAHPPQAIDAIGRWHEWCQTFKPAPIWVSEWGANGAAHPADGGEAATRQMAYWLNYNSARHAIFTNVVDDWSAGWEPYGMFTKDGRVTGVGRGWLTR